MSYNHTLMITLPAELADIAAKVGRAFDPDVGGADSFTLSEDGMTISTTTPCTESFHAQAEYMLVNPEAMHAAIEADYSARWADLTPPTLVEIEAFCFGVMTPEAL